jgi:hypothetical protein
MRSLLVEAGYCVLLRTNGWAECFVQRDLERWEGRGQSEDEAFDDAMGKMFPSHLARSLLDRHIIRPPAYENGEARDAELGAAAGHTSIAATLIHPGERPRAFPDIQAGSQAPPRIEPRAALPGGPAVAIDAPAELLTMKASLLDHQPVIAAPSYAAEPATPHPTYPTPEPPAETVADPAPDLPTSMGDDAASASGLPVDPKPRVDEAISKPLAVAPVVSVMVGSGLPPANEAAPERPARVRTLESVESVERLLAGIEERLGQLARMCGERQRLHMMVWICRARAVEEANPGAREVEHAVARVARRLTEIGKMFWPGSVRALQLSARPADVRREMHASWAAEPADWSEATALAERLLDEHLTKSPEAGLDEDGWADSAARTPRPAEPETLFEEVDAELKALLIPSGEVPNGRLGDLGSGDLDQLVTAARKLRWLRGCVRDDLAWGVAMGRLRRAVPNLGERSSRVRDALDHRSKPAAPWAKLLGELPSEPAPAPGESPAELRAALTTAHMTKEGFLAWLIRAFDVINTPDLVALLVPLKGELAAFGEETLNHPDRRIRRRLRELVKRVASADDAPGSTISTKEPVRDVEETSDEPIAAHALDDLAARVRDRTQGRRALFVSNREDPELGTRLSDMLGIEITWCDGSLRRVQAQCERIKGGSYNLVLSATGFQVHGVDSALARAASTAGVPYVRVNRGRPVACVQAIAREFGLLTDTYRPAKASSAV